MPYAPQPPRIALFGGSFDPVHDGHLAIARAAVTDGGVQKVIFLPARISPHKCDALPPAPGEDRLEMLRLATAGLPWAETSRWELDQAPPSWTWRTLGHFQMLYPDSRLCWLLGADQWESLESWARPDILRAGLSFVVFPRPPHAPPAPKPGWDARFLELIHPASATSIRRAIAGGCARPEFLPEAVARHIAARKLYQPPDGL